MNYESPGKSSNWETLHVLDHETYLESHKSSVKVARKEGPSKLAELNAKLFGRICKFKTLRCAWEYLAARGGPAPGDDGLTYKDFDEPNRYQLWKVLREIRSDLALGKYVPMPLRKVVIKKTSGIGKRTLQIPSIWDRVVQRAILEIIQPFIDPEFDTRSFAWRPKRGRKKAIQRVRQLAGKGKRVVWVTEDIKDCFEQIPRNRLLDVLKTKFPSKELQNLFKIVIGKGKKHGVPQGGTLMPFLVNVYLDHFLDKKWRKKYPSVPLIRYGDDILLLCRDYAEAESSRDALNGILLCAGLPLKGTKTTSIRNLEVGERADWLGLNAFLVDGTLKFHISEKGWNALRIRLEESFSIYGSTQRYWNVIEGWVFQLVTCEIDIEVEPNSVRVRQILEEAKFEFLTCQDAIRKLWHGDNSMWTEMRKACKGGS